MLGTTKPFFSYTPPDINRTCGEDADALCYRLTANADGYTWRLDVIKRDPIHHTWEHHDAVPTQHNASAQSVWSLLEDHAREMREPLRKLLANHPHAATHTVQKQHRLVIA